jgi:hypothetical protein
MIIEQGKCICPPEKSLINGKCIGVGLAGIIVQNPNPLHGQINNIYNAEIDPQSSQGIVYIPEGTINQYFEFSSPGTSSQSASTSLITPSSSSSSSSSIALKPVL